MWLFVFDLFDCFLFVAGGFCGVFVGFLWVCFFVGWGGACFCCFVCLLLFFFVFLLLFFFFLYIYFLADRLVGLQVMF